MSSGGEEVATDLNADGKQAQKKKKTAPSLFSPGDLVWAKVSGFKFWAGKVVDAVKEQFLPEHLKVPPKENCTLVRFFGTYDYHWAYPSSVMTYEAGMKKRLHSKSRGRSFMLAVKEAKEFHELNTLPEGFLKPTPGTSGRDDKRVAEQQKEDEPDVDPSPVPKRQKRSKRQDRSNDNDTSTVEKAVESEPVVDKSEKAVRERRMFAMRRLGLMGPNYNLGKLIN